MSSKQTFWMVSIHTKVDSVKLLGVQHWLTKKRIFQLQNSSFYFLLSINSRLELVTLVCPNQKLEKFLHLVSELINTNWKEQWFFCGTQTKRERERDLCLFLNLNNKIVTWMILWHVWWNMIDIMESLHLLGFRTNKKKILNKKYHFGTAWTLTLFI